MKKLLLTLSTKLPLIIGMLVCTIANAQTPPPPEGINYQAIARDTAGSPISSSISLDVRFTILSDTSGSGTSIFTETHTPVNTNRYGLFTLVIGSVETADFQNLNWDEGDKFLKVEIDGGTGFTPMAITRLMSVPYALHSKTSGSAANNWGFQGDSIAPTDFIGTTNPEDLIIKTAGTEKMRVQSLGNVGIGTSNPAALLSVGTASEFQVSSTGAIDTATGINSSGVIRFSALSADGIVRSTGSNGTLSSSGGQINLTSEVIGSLPIANGGTGLTSLGNWQAFYSDGSGALTPFALGDSGKVFQSNGPALAPSWVTPSLSLQNLTNGTGISAFTYDGTAAAAVSLASIITAGTITNSFNGTTITMPEFTYNAFGQINSVNTNALAVNVEAPLTFNNGLTRTSNTIQLGGPLTQHTTITGGAFDTHFDLLNSGKFRINKVGGTSAFFVDSTGFIGIGTEVSNSPLTISTDLAPTEIQFAGGGNANIAASTQLDIGSMSSLHLLTNGATRLSVINGGNVGIGTTIPTAKLHVITSGAVEGINSSTVLGTGSLGVFANFNSLNPSPAVSALTNGAGPSLMATNTGTAQAGFFTISNSSNAADALYAETNGSGNAIFGKNTSTGKAGYFQVLNSSSTAEALYVTSNGDGDAFYATNVGAGIGRAGNFKTGNSNTADATLYAENNNAGHAIFGKNTGSGNALYATNTGTGNAAIFDQGNVGIGLTAPASKMHVAGQIRTGIPLGGLGGASATNGSILFNNATNINTVTILSGATSASYTLTLPTTAATGANQVLANNGGILTWAAGASPAWYLTGNATTAPSTSVIGTPIPSGQNYIGTSDSKDFVIGTNNLERMRISSAGNIGIGTATPTSPLTIQTRVGDEIKFVSTGSHADITANSRLNIGSSNDDVHITAGTTNLSIFNSGNVGIGTTAPGAGLVVSGSGSGIWKSAIGIENTTAAMEWRMTTADDGTFNIVKLTGATFTAMTINPTSGNVGIGTAAPGTSLEVNGAITYTPDSISLNASATLTPGNRGYIKLKPTVASLSVTGFSTVGAIPGQMVIIENIGLQVTIVDNSGVQLDANSSYFMGPKDTLTLIYNGTEWLEIGRSNN